MKLELSMLKKMEQQVENNMTIQTPYLKEMI